MNDNTIDGWIAVPNEAALFKDDLHKRIMDVAESRHRKQLSQVITNKSMVGHRPSMKKKEIRQTRQYSQETINSNNLPNSQQVQRTHKTASRLNQGPVTSAVGHELIKKSNMNVV